MARHWTAAALGGLQTKLDQRLVAPPEWIGLSDVDLNTRGAFGVRTGYEEMPLDVLGGGTLDITAAESVFWRDEELLIVVDRTLYSWVPSARAWASKGPWWRGDLRITPLVDTAQDQDSAEAAQVMGMQIVFWEQASGLYYTVLADPRNAKSVIVPPQIISATWSRPRAVPLDDRVLVFAVDTDSSPDVVQAAVWYPDDPFGLLSWAPVATISSPDFAYDVRRDGDTVVLASFDAPTIALRRLDQSGAVIRANAYIPSGTPAGPVAIAPGGADLNDEVLVAWTRGTVFVAAWMDDDLNLSRAEQNLGSSGDTPARLSAVAGATVVAGSSVPQFHLAVEWELGNDWQRYVTYYRSTASVPGVHLLTDVDTQRGAQLAAHLAPYDDGAFATLVYPGVVTGQVGSVAVVQHVPTLAIVGRAYELGRAVPRSDDTLASSQVADQIFRAPLVYRTRFRVDVSDPSFFAQTAIGQIEIDFTARALAAAQLGGSCYAAMAGYLACYDGGLSAVEQGYHVVPEIVSAVDGGSGLVPAGTYSVAVVYAWVDERNRLHVSGVAETSVAVTGSSTIDLVVTTCRLTARRSSITPVQIWVYLSVAGAGAGEPRYLVTDLAAPDLNDPDVDTIDIEIDVDAGAPEFIARDRLYTQGGVLSFDPTPATRWVAVASDRLWTGDPERPFLARASNILAEGYAVAFNPLTGVEAPVETVATALGQQDGVYALFSARQPYVFAGDGPAPTVGGSQGWSDPAKVPADSGATSQETLAEVPEGIIYSGERGPRLFSRGQVASAFYEPVERFYLRFGQVVSAAAYRPDIGDLVLAAADNEITEQRRRTVRYSVTTQRWCSDTRHNARDVATSNGGQFAMLRYDGRPCLANESYGTGLVPVQPQMDTPWARVDDSIDPGQRLLIVTVIGEYLAPHRIRISLAYDYEPRYVDARTIDPEAVRAALPLYGVDNAIHGNWAEKSGWGEANNTEGDSGKPWPYQAYQWRYQLTRACEAVSARVTILQGLEFTEAAEIAAIQLDVDWYHATDDRHALPRELEFPASPVP